MPTATEDPVVDEKVWRAWVQRGKLQEKATARKAIVFVGVAVVLLALGGAVYKFAAG